MESITRAEEKEKDAGTFVVGSIGFNFTWHVITNDPGLLRHDASEAMIAKIMRSYRNGVPIYLIAMLGAFVSVYVTMGICTALWIYWSAVARDV
jgi:hypothetical protein